MQKDDVLLRMEGICKSFPGVKALDDAQLTVRPGTVHALMGENGAGKSTLMKCLFGIYSKDAGTIWFDGKEVNFKSSRDALDNGVAMVHQELNQALKRSVMDNIWLGRYPRIKLGGAKMPFVSDKAEYDMTMEVFKDLNFEKFGININPRTIMSTMPVSRRQMVEIAKAVSFNSKIIVLDEPTSSLTEAEVAKMGVETTVDLEVEYKVGDTVEITAGPMEGSVGTVDEIDIPARKVRVKITMFGRELPAELELHQVKLF